MKGFPKTINTKQDVLNLLPDFPAETTEYLRKLLNERKHWQNGNYIENPNAVLFQMGFTTAEALAIVTDYVEPPTPEPPLTPEQEAEKELLAWRQGAKVSRLKARIALKQAGVFDTVQSFIDDPETPLIAKEAWSQAYEFSRNSQLFEAFGPVLGFTPTQIDDLFRAAQQIEV